MESFGEKKKTRERICDVYAALPRADEVPKASHHFLQLVICYEDFGFFT